MNPSRYIIAAVAVLGVAYRAAAGETTPELLRAEGIVRAAVSICFESDETTQHEGLQLSNGYLRALSAATGTPLSIFRQTVSEYESKALAQPATVTNWCKGGALAMLKAMRQRANDVAEYGF